MGQRRPERGLVAPLLPAGLHHRPSDVWGYELDGGVGLEALGDGCFYVGRAAQVVEDGVVLQSGTAVLHRWTGDVPTPLVPVR